MGMDIFLVNFFGGLGRWVDNGVKMPKCLYNTYWPTAPTYTYCLFKQLRRAQSHRFFQVDGCVGTGN